jgi:hypothetical protein
MNRVEIEERYKKWWKGKHCRIAGQGGDFELVVDVKYYASPSGVYGTVELIFANGGTAHPGACRFRAAKKDVEVKEENDYKRTLEKRTK